ncbi:helix-turn-helix transcriptional regulator [Paractinoplanes pyxinae]|uniref:helix-turn-helix transcriptional regulator n=1 Tax=Paractinoplanes pyxinae TaxID=2997416 RepID=UPI002D1E44A6|nr:LuxR C-terminal-related transcriptional regulator [Actinoplanes pyxinae]
MIHAQLPLSLTRPAPPLPAAYLPRRRLWERLEQVHDSAVVVLVAPAGAGKTVGVSGWLRRDRPSRPGVIWICADAGYSAATLRNVLDAAAAAGGSRPALVVIDDAHRLPADALLLIDHRLRHDPASLHLLLLSRTPLALHHLVPALLGDLAVLHGDVLRLTPDESRTLTLAHVRIDSADLAEAVAERAQGWCAVHVLTARNVAAAADPLGAARAGLDGSRAEAARQIVDETFAGLSDTERHLLLCIAGEQVVTSDLAEHLTRDAAAPEALEQLEATALLVQRVSGPAEPARYRVHPVLQEVIHRRLSRPGSDEDRARAAVRQAVRLDLARNDHERAFGRLEHVGDHEGAAHLLATEGLSMVLRGEGEQIAAFVARHSEAVLAAEDCWFTVAVECWLRDDVAGARYWMNLILDRPPLDSVAAGVQRACLRLMRARLGQESIAAAVADGRRLVADVLRRPAAQECLPLLLLELAVTQMWTGDLDEAEVHLSSVIALSRSHVLPALEAAATSHLALSQYMLGRERAGVEVANVALAAAAGLPEPAVRFSVPRAGLALSLSRMSAPPWLINSPDRTPPSIQAADLCTLFWLTIEGVALALTRASVADAAAVLDPPMPILEQTEIVTAAGALPLHLQRALLVNRALLAALAADSNRLTGIGHTLQQLGAAGEAALVQAFRADLHGDRRAAYQHFSTAAQEATCLQPPVAAVAMVCAAQLRDSLGDNAGALDDLEKAVALTEVRRNALPFLGWLRHGTPISDMLLRLSGYTASPWLNTVVQAAISGTDIVDYFSARSSRAEPVRADAGRQALTRRERDVLAELARGATYADIAAAHFIAESTVKTHVSSLYAKLGASRRSEALATARRERLI